MVCMVGTGWVFAHACVHADGKGEVDGEVDVLDDGNRYPPGVPTASHCF